MTRLVALRAELNRQSLQGFIVPRADEHQGEYVPPSAQRLEWLTGFTGSAGSCVILPDRAAIFVDGRYTIQVGQEVDTSLFEPLHLVEHPPAKFLAEAAPQDARIGFDPWLHTPDQAETLRRACERAGATLVACPANPVDRVWTDRPAPPTTPVVAYPISFAGEDSSQKRDELARFLAGEGLDACLLSDPASVAWLLNIRGNDVEFTPLPLCFALVSSDGSVALFMDQAKASEDLMAHLGPHVALHPPAALETALDGLAGKKVRVDATTVPFALTERLLLAGARTDKGADPCALPKACKNAVELDGMREAHRRDGVALCRFLAWLAANAPKGGVNEMQAADRLEAFRAEGSHFRGLSFPTIAGAGPNGAIVHYRADAASNRLLEPEQLFLLDSGAQYLNGTTDVTRTIAIGEAGDEERRRFTLVLKGHISVATALFPAGTTGSQLDVLARLALWSAGLDYDHGTGHGVGCYLSVHEGPQRISKTASTVALKPGMILSNEPGYYKKDAYGIRIENLVAVQPAHPLPDGERQMLGFETLTLAPIDRTLIEPGLLSDGERGWLDAYHARVLAEIGPHVDSATRNWLEFATSPIG